MVVIDDLTGDTIEKEVKKQVDSNADLTTDDAPSYSKLSTLVQKHTPYNMKYNYVEKVLPWVHKAITNAKNLLKSIFHCVNREYLQNYLDEFCYKFNRRYMREQMFDRIEIAAISSTWF